MNHLLKNQHIDLKDIQRTSSGGSGSVDLEKKLKTTQTELDEALSALKAYKRAFDEQHGRLRMEREANMKLANKSFKSGNYAQEYKNQAIQNLANQLTETLSEKEIALAEMRTTNKCLATRMAQLEETILQVDRERTIERKVMLEVSQKRPKA
jgi:endonuclease IV